MLSKLSWFALYTRPRFEFKADASLKELGFNSFLPTQKTLKTWSDRKKWVTEPLFRSYCFVQTYPEKYFEVLKAYGVVKYIWFEGKPQPVRDTEINVLKKICESKQEVDVVSYNFKKGQKVKITCGSLIGLTGEYLKNKNKHSILIRVDSVNQGLLVTINPDSIIVCK